MDLNTTVSEQDAAVHEQPQIRNAPKEVKGSAKGWANLIPAKKGEVRNPRGRAKKDFALAELAQQHAKKAIQTLVEVMSDTAATPSARVGAASEILDRGFGRAPQSIDLKATMTLSSEFESFIRSLRAGNDADVLDVTPQIVSAE